MFFTRWVHNIRTALDLAERVNAVEEAMDNIEMEWVDKREAFTLLVKRLATRAARASHPVEEDSPADGDHSDRAGADRSPSPADGKDRLRELARLRGFRV